MCVSICTFFCYTIVGQLPHSWCCDQGFTLTIWQRKMKLTTATRDLTCASVAKLGARLTNHDTIMHLRHFACVVRETPYKLHSGGISAWISKATVGNTRVNKDNVCITRTFLRRRQRHCKSRCCSSKWEQRNCWSLPTFCTRELIFSTKILTHCVIFEPKLCKEQEMSWSYQNVLSRQLNNTHFSHLWQLFKQILERYECSYPQLSVTPLKHAFFLGSLAKQQAITKVWAP